MAKLVYLLCAAVLIQANVLSAITSEETLAFCQGFLQGIETDSSQPSQCALDISSALDGSNVIVNDISDFISGTPGAWTKLVLDLQKSKSILNPIKTSCDFSGLEAKIEELMTPEFATILLQNYFHNLNNISPAIANLELCEGDATCIGLNSGIIAKYLIGWSLNSSRVVKLQGPSADPVVFVNGLILGLRANPDEPSVCVTQGNLLVKNLETLFEDAENAVNGASGSLLKLLNDFSSFKKEFPDMPESCNLEGLVEKIAALTTGNGIMSLMKIYQNNLDVINSDLSIIQDCDTNMFACGQAVGNMVQILVGWSI